MKENIIASLPCDTHRLRRKGGIFLVEKRAQVRSMRLVTGPLRIPESGETVAAKQNTTPEPPMPEKRQGREPAEKYEEGAAILTTCEKRNHMGGAMLSLDNLLRNVAVVGALLLVIVALRGAGNPQAQSVFSAIQAGMNMEWDESLGKLSFVNNLIPESVQAVWGERNNLSVMAPCHGEIVHAWSRSEPYLEIQSSVADVRAVANGEVMAIAHGLEEEVIIRLRHDDHTESLYGNLAECYMDEGDYVFQGDIIAAVLRGKPLAFELRQDGRSIDPKGKLQSLTD